MNADTVVKGIKGRSAPRIGPLDENFTFFNFSFKCPFHILAL